MVGPQTLNLYNIRSNRILPTILFVFLLCFPAAAETIIIRNNPGGNVIHFLIQKDLYEKERTYIRFDGRCDSACTLFLGLPNSQLCVTPNASFRFHKPRSKFKELAHVASKKMMKTYPNWVRVWIYSEGGLSSGLITMRYSYVKRFLKTCKEISDV